MTVIPDTRGIAAVDDAGATAVPQLFAGDTPPVVTTDVLLPAGAVAQYVPLGPGYAAWAAGDEIVALTAYASPGGVRAAVYQAGCFNLDAIAWPAGTTEAQVQAASQSSQLKFRKLLYSQYRTGDEGAPGNEAGPQTT